MKIYWCHVGHTDYSSPAFIIAKTRKIGEEGAYRYLITKVLHSTYGGPHAPKKGEHALAADDEIKTPRQVIQFAFEEI
jgi:ligand-binding sensor protein